MLYLSKYKGKIKQYNLYKFVYYNTGVKYIRDDTE